jgi:hypothetical protein
MRRNQMVNLHLSAAFLKDAVAYNQPIDSRTSGNPQLGQTNTRPLPQGEDYGEGLRTTALKHPLRINPTPSLPYPHRRFAPPLPDGEVSSSVKGSKFNRSDDMAGAIPIPETLEGPEKLNRITPLL